VKILPLKGIRSLKALNVFHTLMLGLKMLPMYAGQSYEDFFLKVEAMPENDREKLIREAVLFVDLKEDEVEAMLRFCADANGVPFGPENIKNLSPSDIHEAIVQVSCEISKIKVNFITEDEKKNLKTAALTSGLQ
jgi:hypothetical protein